MDPKTRQVVANACEQCQTLIREAFHRIPAGQRLDHAFLSEVTDLDTRIAFVLGELDFLRRDVLAGSEDEGSASAAGAGTLDPSPTPAATISCREAPTLPAPAGELEYPIWDRSTLE